MTSEIRCRSCSRSVSADFRYCPYCQAALVHGATDAPLVTPAPAERQGHRDLMWIGLGLVALGLFGLVGAVLSGFGDHRGANTPVPIVGGALLAVVAGSVMAGAARGGWSGAGSGLLTGCASVVVVMGVGAMLVLAAIAYAFLSCVSDLNKLGH
jgi:uncharacterized membrane-anchored protein